jgi:phospholipid-translocating ATPase
MVISQLLSLGVYVCSIIFLHTLFDIQYINAEFALKVTAITFISWLPLHLAKILSKRLDPTDYEKIMRGVTMKKKEPTTIEIL